MKLQPGDIILSFNTTNFFSRLVSEVTNSAWSHSMMYIGNGNVVESTIGGVRITSLKHYQTNQYHLKFLRIKDISESQAKKISRDVLDLLGVEYGYLQLIWSLFIRLIGQSENPKWQKDIQPDAVTCSEAIAFVLQMEGLEIKKDFHSSGIEPADFAESDIFVTL